MIKNYKILSVVDDHEYLSELILEYIKNGWKLYGSPFSSSWSHKDRDGYDEISTEYCQAMIKEEE